MTTGGASAGDSSDPNDHGERSFDLITMGRSSIDLYANEIGRPFEQIESFNAYVGGSPTNIAVAARRLGLDVALLTAVGEDKVGSFILNFLVGEGIDTSYVSRKAGARSSAVLLGIEPPDRFPLVFYRDNAADMQLTIDDVLAAPISRSRALEISGTGLSREPSRSATFLAAERARGAGTTVYMDLDFRADQWHDPRA
ncbi:MAG: PfkB family carbohydrate kinase, partial [Trueperaceae bacterium]